MIQAARANWVENCAPSEVGLVDDKIADPGVGGVAGTDHAENGDGDALPGSWMAQLRDQIGDARDEPRPRGGAGTETNPKGEKKQD